VLAPPVPGLVAPPVGAVTPPVVALPPVAPPTPPPGAGDGDSSLPHAAETSAPNKAFCTRAHVAGADDRRITKILPRKLRAMLPC